MSLEDVRPAHVKGSCLRAGCREAHLGMQKCVSVSRMLTRAEPLSPMGPGWLWAPRGGELGRGLCWSNVEKPPLGVSPCSAS